MRIKEIISEDLLRASAASGGQQVPVMPPITLYPQPPRPVIPPPVPRTPNSNSVPGQGHRPAAPHSGVCKHNICVEVFPATNVDQPTVFNLLGFITKMLPCHKYFDLVGGI